MNLFRESMMHVLKGTHGAFKGRRYRRGKNRCVVCGAPLTAGSSEGLAAKLMESIADRNRLIEKIQRA